MAPAAHKQCVGSIGDYDQSPSAEHERIRFRSMAVILFNKWLLAYSGFPFPLALTM